MVLGRDEEEDKVMFAHDLDVGFIPSIKIIDRAFSLKIEEMAGVSSGFGVV